MPDFHVDDVDYAGVCVLVNVDRDVIDAFVADYAAGLLGAAGGDDGA